MPPRHRVSLTSTSIFNTYSNVEIVSSSKIKIKISTNTASILFFADGLRRLTSSPSEPSLLVVVVAIPQTAEPTGRCASCDVMCDITMSCGLFWSLSRLSCQLTQALHGHMSTGQGATADAVASAAESGNAGQELVYLQVFRIRVPSVEACSCGSFWSTPAKDRLLVCGRDMIAVERKGREGSLLVARRCWGPSWSLLHLLSWWACDAPPSRCPCSLCPAQKQKK